MDEIKPGMLRLRISAPPGFTRPVLRDVVKALVGRAIRATVRELPFEHCATILLSPREVFPAGIGGRKILHVTDDWVAGSSMMGLSQQAVSTNLRSNINAADTVCIVSPSLGGLITERNPDCVPVVLPNGCLSSHHLNNDGVRMHQRRAVAALVGQLNERLDLDLLDQLVASGVEIEVIGPRRERDLQVRRRLDKFLASEGVSWLGEIPEGDAFARMQTAAVGITPYADTVFNRASFPIKTLDYLAAGMQVVSTDLPSARWLDSEWVNIADSTTNFVSMVRHILGGQEAEQNVAARRSFASQHTWDARASQLMAMIDEGELPDAN
ncbi:glycosyltransferase [Arthrobacter sp. LAPM80]|uniref:glycosyltransferase n=1 Tax=Arthrobacter sp. LAPM80 TaxID=3141788 RepID=UPI00398B3E7A